MTDKVGFSWPGKRKQLEFRMAAGQGKRSRKLLTKAYERDKIPKLVKTRAGLAQPVERLIRNHEVGGSSPPSSSSKAARKQGVSALLCSK